MVMAGVTASADTWTAVGQGSMTEPCFSYIFDKASPTYSVTVEKSNETQGLYRVVDPFGPDNPNYKSIIQVIGVHSRAYIEINVSNPDAVSIKEQPIGWVDDYDTYYIKSLHPGKLVDGVLTFAKDDVRCTYGSGNFTCDKTTAFSLSFPDLLTAKPVAPVTLDPAQGERLSSFTGVTITFDKQISEASTDGIVMTKDAMGGDAVCSRWTVSVKDSTIVLTPNTSVSLLPDEDFDVFYYITIPSGVFKSSDGTVNDAFTIQYLARSFQMAIKSYSPAEGSALQTFTGFTITSTEGVTFADDIYPKFSVGSPDAPTLVKSWSASRIDSYTVTFKAGTTVMLDPGVDYYLTIPYGLLTGAASGTKNYDTVLKFTGYSETAIRQPSVGNATVTVKRIDGNSIVITRDGNNYTVNGVMK